MNILLTILGIAVFIGLICLIFYLQPRKDTPSSPFELDLRDIWEPENPKQPPAPPTERLIKENDSSRRVKTGTVGYSRTRPVQKRDYAPDSSYRSSSSLNSDGWSTWSSSDYGSSSSSSDSCSSSGGDGGGGGCD